MTDEQKDELRKRNSRRAISCPRCGSQSLEIRDGKECYGLTGINYKICGACGHADPVRVRQRRVNALKR